MDIESISIFKPSQVLDLQDSKICSLDHANKRQYVIGDNKGSVILYEVTPDRSNSQIVFEIKLGKVKVTKVVCLSTTYLMVACIMDSNLYLVDFAKKQQELISKGVTNFSYWQGEVGKPRLFAISKNKGIFYRLNLDATSLVGIFETERETAFPGRVPDCAVWHKNVLCQGFEGKEYSMTVIESNKSIESIKKDVKIIDNPIIEVVNEDEILFLTKPDKSVFIGLIFDSTGAIAPRNNLSLMVKDVKRILITQRYILCVINEIDVVILHKHDMLPLQKLTIPDDKRSLQVSSGLQEIFVASTNKVYFFDLQTYDNQINECIKKCKGKEALSIFEAYYSKFSKVDKRDQLLKNLNYRLSLEFLDKEKYNEAEEAFANSNFDPTELLNKFYPVYQWDYNGPSKVSHINKDSLIFLSKVLLRKRKQILQDH